MGRRHLTPKELCELAKRNAPIIQHNREVYAKDPFTRTATICHYHLFKQENWKKRKLTAYIKRLKEYHSLFDDDRNQWEIQQNRILNILGENFYLDVQEKAVSKDKRSSYLNFFYQKEAYNANLSIYQIARYMLAHFNTLIDMELPKDRIEVNKSLVEQTLYLNDEKKEMEMWSELREKVGIEIELAKIGDEENGNL